jgi:hypothetical protein
MIYGMNVDTNLISTISFAPPVVFLVWKLIKTVSKAKEIARDHKAKKILRKMASSLGLFLKKSRGGQWFITYRAEDNLDRRALSYCTNVDLLSESTSELKEKLVNVESLKVGESDTAIKNIFFEKTDTEIEVLTDLAAR